MTNRFYANVFNAAFGSQAKSASINQAFSAIQLAFDELQAEIDARIGARTAPHANFDWFTSRFPVLRCSGPGGAWVGADIYDVWMTEMSSAMTGGGTVATYVDGTNGNDGTGTGGITAPYATIDKAIRTSNSGLVYVMPGTYASTGFRYTDTQGDRPKMIVAPYGGVTIKTSGDVLSSRTWTSVGGGTPNVYYATLVTANHAIRVLDSANVDELGLAMPMPKYSSVATVDAAGYGWWYDSGTQRVYVRIGALNVESVKSRLSAVYATAGDNSLQVLAATLYLENVVLEHYIFCLNVSGQATPQIWMKNCTLRYGESSSRNVQGGYSYSQGCTYYRGSADHANYNISNGVTSRGAEINDTTWFAGDVASFGAGATQPDNPISSGQNKNSSSNHDSYVVRVNGVHRGSYGPVLADTNGSYTWNLGVETGYSYATGSSRYGLVVQGSNARAWIDGCVFGAGASGANADSSAQVFFFNTSGTQTATSSGTFTGYVPTT